MWIRIIGGLLVFFSCTALGTYFSLRESFRINDLTELKKALLLLKGEIEFARSPLHEAMSTVALRLHPRLAVFFNRIRDNLLAKSGIEAKEAWGEAVNSHLTGLHLNSEDIANILRLGETLGYLSARTQAEGLEMAVLYIDAQVDKLRETEGKSRRLCRNAGIMFGMLIIIVLI